MSSNSLMTPASDHRRSECINIVSWLPLTLWNVCQVDGYLLQLLRMLRGWKQFCWRKMCSGVWCLLYHKVNIDSDNNNILKPFVVFRETGCSSTITQNSTHIQNPNYPSAYTDTTGCSYTFKKTSLDICSIRLEFVRFEIRGPDVNNSPYTTCSYDTVWRWLEKYFT